MPDITNPSWNRLQEARRKLNLVKAHAHEIVGVKREQVSMVVENFSKPGTYDITVHDSGQVYTAHWTPPAPDEVFPTFDPEKCVDEVVEAMDEVEAQEVPSSPPADPTPIPFPTFVTEPTPPSTPEEPLVSEAEEVPTTPEPAPRRRGRPKKIV